MCIQPRSQCTESLYGLLVIVNSLTPEMCVYVYMCMQHVVRAATKEYPDVAEIKGCVTLPRKPNDLLHC